MPAEITNAGGEAISLPYPFEGVLGASKSIVLNLTQAQALTLLGTLPQTGGLKVDDLPNYTGAFDTAYMGNAIAGGTATMQRQTVGPFSVTLAASQTAAAMTYGVSGGTWTAPR